MSIFKKGDVIKCVGVRGACGITKGKLYTVTGFWEGFLMITDDNGSITTYTDPRFVALRVLREDIITEILK